MSVHRKKGVKLHRKARKHDGVQDRGGHHNRGVSKKAFWADAGNQDSPVSRINYPK